MSGLALGVGYSLLILDRFHQQHEPPGDDPRRRARSPRPRQCRTTGRAMLLAGTGLILALLLATAIAPTKILASLGVGVLLCSALALGGAVVVMPAALVLFGRASSSARGSAPAALTRDWDRLVGAGGWVRHRAVLAGGSPPPRCSRWRSPRCR